ncbi:MAG TPA: formate--tetrahydrofolate ligase, partial [Thermoplasmatales archaeon]|nr:formate--tetrahydrofolate ligase [Thermoplasmatales archaeon]
TAASEVMAILCLSRNMEELKEKLARVIAAYSYDERPITAEQLNAVGAMAALLKDAIKPNLVQTTEGVAAFVHGGPFANIAHGTSSIISTMMGLKLADYFVTEAGFGTDLGAEKFFNIVGRHGIRPDAVVLVVSIRALKWHGGMSMDDIKKGRKNMRALRKGLANLAKHMENIEMFGLPMVVVLNRFPTDREEEIRAVEEFCGDVPFAVADVYNEGGEGGIELAGKVVSVIHNKKPKFRFLYPLDVSVKEKIEAIARNVYGAGKVVYSITAEDDIRIVNKLGLDMLPICMAKTPYSLSDDPSLRGRPTNFKITVKEIRISAGAGFLVPITGKITTMPGLPAKPAAVRIDVDERGRITGIE